MSWFRNHSLAALVAVAIVGGACAEERTPIDRTQPNILDKAYFQGEWLFGQTVVKIPSSESFTFVGENTWLGLERVRWDIQERWLYARRSYERIKDGDTDVVSDGVMADGSLYLGPIVAAFRIESHFDIKRAYNPTTGEEYNVLEENSSDRPWYERTFMRVDWSRNNASNFDFLADDVAQDAINYYVQDPNHEDYPVFEDGEFDAAGRMITPPYFDVTNVVMAQPTMTYIPEIDESYPTCWFFEHATADCTTEPIHVRLSFMRVNPDRQYVPAEMKGVQTDFFGIFRQERLVWDPKVYVNYKKQIAFSQIHNLWKTWTDADGNLLHPSQRELRPIVYYAVNYPRDLYDTVKIVEHDWDVIFRQTVGAAQNVYWEDVPQTYHICWTDKNERGQHVLAEGEHPDCGTPGLRIRPGDMRYSTTTYVDGYYDGFRLLGFGPSNTDPLTGEVLSANAWLYVWNENVSQATAEMVQLLNGDIDPTSYINGLDLTNYMAKAETEQRQSMQRTVSREELDRYVQAQSFDWAKKMNQGFTGEQLQHMQGMPMRKVISQVGDVIYDMGAFNGDMNPAEERLASLQGTYIERMLVNDEVKMIAGLDPTMPTSAFTDEMMRDASVARLGPMKAAAAIQRYKDDLIRRNQLDVMNTPDDGYWGMAQQWKGWDIEDVVGEIRKEVYQAVMTHELGHTFSLHHNFGGTEDVVNYFDDYWMIRDDGEVGPRFEDPVTDAELEANIYRYGYSSIMDYSRIGLDHAPGKYDRAAIFFAYANLVEAFYETGSVDEEIAHEWSIGDGGVLMFYFPRPIAFHYTEWWNSMGDNVYRADNRFLASARPCEALDDVDCTEWDERLGGASKPGTVHSPDGNAYVRVPYIFCSPYQSDIGNGCFTRDFGGDEYERVTHHLQNANTWYITRAFTRSRVGSTPEGYVGRTFERLYGRLKGFNDYYALIGSILYMYFEPDQIEDFLSDPIEGWGSYTIAEHDIVNFLLRTIATPDIKEFTQTVDGAGNEVYGEAMFLNPANPETDVTNGRFFTTAWYDTNYNDDCGMYFWQCLHHFGFYLDKIMVLEAMSDAQTYFVARDTSEDVRQWRISFWDNYAGVINDFMGGVLAQDYAAFAPRARKDIATGKTTVVHRDYADPAGTQPDPAWIPMEPATGFSVQLYAAVLGMARFQNNFDQSFLDSTRMWLKGSSLAIAPACGTVSYTDPTSGKVYEAINFADGHGVAQRMIARANRVYLNSSYCVETVCNNDDDCRPLGLSCDTDANLCGGIDCAAEINPKADGELMSYGQLLDVIVDLTGYYQTFAGGYGDPYNPGGLPEGRTP